MNGNLITTHTDRLWHMQKCRKQDRDHQARHGDHIPSERHYETVGDIAAVNDWRYHASAIGHECFYINTPDWIVDIAIRQKWICTRGELALCTNCDNIEGGCPVCCPEAYAGDVV